MCTILIIKWMTTFNCQSKSHWIKGWWDTISYCTLLLYIIYTNERWNCTNKIELSNIFFTLVSIIIYKTIKTIIGVLVRWDPLMVGDVHFFSYFVLYFLQIYHEYSIHYDDLHYVQMDCSMLNLETHSKKGSCCIYMETLA